MSVHIVAIYAGLLGLLLMYLSYQTVIYRRKEVVDIGMGEGKQLARAVRSHANFTEYVPLALFLILLLEQTSFPDWAVHALGAMLLVGRILHAWGFVRNVGVSFGRVGGTLLTWVVTVVASVANLYFALA